MKIYEWLDSLNIFILQDLNQIKMKLLILFVICVMLMEVLNTEARIMGGGGKGGMTKNIKRS